MFGFRLSVLTGGLSSSRQMDVQTKVVVCIKSKVRSISITFIRCLGALRQIPLGFDFGKGGGCRRSGPRAIEMCSTVHCPFKTFLHMIYVDCSF